MPSWTNFPNGITSLGIPTFGTGILPPFTGKYLFVQEVTTAGVSAGQGTAQQPFNTIQQALAECTSGHNDVVFVIGTIHLTAAVAWNKNNTHLVGLCAPLKRGKRARFSSSGSTPFTNLFTVTANGCMFSNFGTFYGFPTTGSTTPVMWSDTGGRNNYDNVEFMGFGDATVTTGTANQTTARAFVMNTSTGESTFRSCVFGPDTVVRNAANWSVEIAGGAPRITFQDCDFEADLGSSGAGAGHILIGSGGIDRYLNFQRCHFMNSVNSGATVMTQVASINASAGGLILLDNCSWYGATKFQTTANSTVYSNIPVFNTTNAGLTSAVV